MEKYTILNYEYDTSYSYKDTENVYEVQAKSKIFKFIIKFLIKHKIIKQYQERVTCQTAKRVCVNTQEIINDLCEKINMAHYAMNGEIAGIMVGREQFKLIRDDYIKSSATIHAPLMYSNDGSRTIMNVPIVLNPFIDGVVLCTKDMLKDMVWR